MKKTYLVIVLALCVSQVFGQRIKMQSGPPDIPCDATDALQVAQISILKELEIETKE